MYITRGDALYIGYPKAASTFIRSYLSHHPKVTVDHNCAADILTSPHEPLFDVGKPHPNKVHVSVDEGIVESVITDGTDYWRLYRDTPGAWDKVKDHITIDADLTAAAFQKVYPWKTKIIIVTRDQVSWLKSFYQYSISCLPAGRRTFQDFLETPEGRAILYAGHHDVVINAWRKRFQHVRVFRYEQLATHIADFMSELTDFLEIPLVYPKELPLNDSHPTVARIQRAFPFVDRLPKSYKRWLKQRIKPLLPRIDIISKEDEQMIRGLYKC